MQKVIIGLVALAIVVALGIYATEKTVEIQRLQREDQLTQDGMDRVERALIRLDARLFGPMGQTDETQAALDGAPEPLPTDEIGKWTSVFVWPRERQKNATAAKLAYYFRRPELQRLLDQTIVAEYEADQENALWRDIYSKHFAGEEVQFWLLKPRAGDAENWADPVYRVSGSNLPDSPDQLAADIQTMIAQACPFKPKPDPKPDPAPVAVTNVQIPDLTPETVEPAEDELPSPWGIVVAAGLAGAGIGYLVIRLLNRKQ
jgi:hypothetical protein